jgi:ribosomal-protein-serine acetyltransferase
VALAHAPALSALIEGNKTFLETYLPKVAGLAQRDAASAHLQHVLTARAHGELFEWHIFRDQQLCGAIRLTDIDTANRKAAVAYYLGAEFQGNGLATTSVRAVIGYAFEHLQLNRIELRCTSENLPSQRIAKRLGFTWEGMLRQAELLRGEFADHFVYSLLRQEARPVV